MKVIDLLNKIANGEEVPKKILVDGKYFYYDSEEMFYQTEDKQDLLEIGKEYSTWDFLTFMVMEIPQIDIEKRKEKEIDIDNIGELERIYSRLDDFSDVGMEIDNLIDGYNGLLEIVRYLNKKIKEKE